MTGTLDVLLIDGAGRAHLLRALAAYERQCRQDGCRLPPPLVALVDALKRQDPTVSEEDAEGGEDAPVAPLLLTVSEVADRLRLSPRSVERAIAAGELNAVRVGRSRRVAPEDLCTYVEGLRSGARLAS